MIGLGLSLTGQRTSASLASLLFGMNEPGFTFEPWDITTLYQDRAGTTPVTAAGQSVGLRLDKSQGLRIGPELVTNGDFAAGNTGWTRSLPSWSAASGVMINDGSNATSASVQQSGVISAGKTYRVTFDFSRTSGSLNLWLAGSQLVQSGINTSGAKSFIVTSTVTGSIFFEATIGAVLSIDNISVREIAGNHEVAVSDAKRGVYGWMPKTGRRNLLTYTEQFDAWSKTSASVAANAAIAPDGTLTADLQTISAQFGGVSQFYSGLSTGATYTVSVWARVDSGSRVYSVVDNSGGGGILGTFTPTTSWVRYNFPLTAGSSSATIFVAQDRSASGFSSVYLWGAQLEVGSTATAYQRVVSQYDVTEAGVPTCYYVQADGVDDAYVTPTITPNTDKAQVFAGVRKLSDAATGMLFETSTNADSNTGAWYLALLSGGNWQPQTGPVGSRTYTPYFLGAAPKTSVLTVTIDNAVAGAGEIDLRENGQAKIGSAIVDGGATGNFLAYPAYIYARGGTTLPFNGLDFGHAVRFGPNLDAATIARVESLIARNTPEVTL